MAEDIQTTSISLAKTLLELGRARARKDRRSFSGHTAKVLESDLVAAGWMTVSGEVTPAGVAVLAADKPQEVLP